MNKLITVAIDGPAGAGKSTIAKIIGEKFNLMYINTGSMYRAVTLKAISPATLPCISWPASVMVRSERVM